MAGLRHDMLPIYYVCTQIDLDAIEATKKIPAAPGLEEVVRIGVAMVKRYHMQCLFEPGEHIYDEVISAYVFLMRTQEHMLKRSGGSAYLEDPLVSVFLKRDGDEEQTMENHYPNYEKREKTSLDERVLTYLKREMVSIPININQVHWYLAVVNAKKHQIQVLDSLGTMLGRKELERTIIGLEREINFVSRRFNLEEVEYRKWPDVKVTTWRVKEII